MIFKKHNNWVIKEFGKSKKKNNYKVRKKKTYNPVLKQNKTKQKFGFYSGFLFASKEERKLQFSTNINWQVLASCHVMKLICGTVKQSSHSFQFKNWEHSFSCSFVYFRNLSFLQMDDTSVIWMTQGMGTYSFFFHHNHSDLL